MLPFGLVDNLNWNSCMCMCPYTIFPRLLPHKVAQSMKMKTDVDTFASPVSYNTANKCSLGFSQGNELQESTELA